MIATTPVYPAFSGPSNLSVSAVPCSDIWISLGGGSLDSTLRIALTYREILVLLPQQHGHQSPSNCWILPKAGPSKIVKRERGAGAGVSNIQVQVDSAARPTPDARQVYECCCHHVSSIVRCSIGLVVLPDDAHIEPSGTRRGELSILNPFQHLPSNEQLARLCEVSLARVSGMYGRPNWFQEPVGAVSDFNSPPARILPMSLLKVSAPWRASGVLLTNNSYRRVETHPGRLQ